MILFNLITFLEELNQKLIEFISNYNSNPVFWIVIVVIIFIIGCWAISYFGRK